MPSPLSIPDASLPLRYADYSRVSSQAQAERELSIPAQQRETHDFARAKGWLHAASFEDKAISGTTMDRPGLQAMLEASRQKLFDVLLIHKMDRLSREELDFLVIKAELKKHGIVIASVTEPFAGGSHPMDEMMETMSRGFAKLYISNLKREIKKGLRQAAEEGRQNGSPPYGYCYKDLSRRGSGWQVDPDHGPWLPRLFARFASGDLSMIDFTRWVNEQAAPLPYTRNPQRQERGWKPVTLRRILMNRAYLGEIVYDEQRPGAHPALIDTDTFDRVQAVLAVRGRQLNGQRRRDNASGANGDAKCTLLSGRLMLCPHCESAGIKSSLILWSSKSGKRKDGTSVHYTHYTCSRREQQTTARQVGSEWASFSCPGFSISETKVLAMLCVALEGIIRESEVAVAPHANNLHAKFDFALKAYGAPGDTAESLAREIEQSAMLRTRYQEMAAKGLMTDDELAGQLTALGKRRASLDARLIEAQSAPKSRPSLSPKMATELLTILKDQSLPAVVRRDKIRAVILNIVPWADREGITIYPCQF